MAKTALTVEQVYHWVDDFAPFETCEGWDNSGLLTGKMVNTVEGIYCALDVSMRVIDDALAQGCNLLLTHHPILFGGRKNLREDDPEGQMLVKLVRERINVISAHTNFDKAPGGVSEALAKAVGIAKPEKIEGDEDGYLRIGEITSQKLSDFVTKVRLTLGGAVRAYGDANQRIAKVAVCGGAGGEYASLALRAGADAYVTGEMRYHDSFDLAQGGFATLQAGHDATERIAVRELKALVERQLEREGLTVPVVLSKVDLFSIPEV